MDLTETVIGTQEIYKGKIVHLRIDTIRQADGREAKREVVAHRGATCIVPVTPDGNILFVEQFRLPAGKVLLEIPAGTLEEGEDPAFCASRELEEETGFKAGNLKFLFSMYMAPGYCSELIHAYLATDLQTGEVNPDEGENLELISLPIAEVEKMLECGEFQDAKSIAALGVALRLLKQ